MDRNEKIQILHLWGENIRNLLSSSAFTALAMNAGKHNLFFTPENIACSLRAICDNYLNQEKLKEFLKPYPEQVTKPKKIGLVMAGNLPLVGFHDLLCVWLAGHQALIKLSAKDNVLLPVLINKLRELSPELASAIEFTDRIKDSDAVIATGSDNTLRYFEYYFGKKPHIFRRNRNSAALLSGTESPDEIKALADDMFLYFGLGCRSVSKLFIPEQKHIEEYFPCFTGYSYLIDHSSWHNNYLYSRTILQMKNLPFSDNGFALFIKDNRLHAGIATIHYEYYRDVKKAEETLFNHQDDLQVVVTNQPIPGLSCCGFGQAQFPQLWNFADSTDTMDFLLKLADK